MPLDHSLSRIVRRIPAPCRTAFCTSVIGGYLTHLFAFTNIIPNSDGLSRVFDPQQMTISGRWFLHYASSFNGFTQMPAVIAFFSILFLSLAAALVVDLLSIRSRTLGGLAGLVMVTFPAVGFAYLYMFTAGAYSFAILLAVLSVWLARKGGLLPLLGGCVALALSMGIYQAYAAVAISLAVLVVLRNTMKPKQDLSSTARLGFGMVGYLTVGAVLYYVVLQVFLKVKHLELLDYLGMSDAGSGYPIGKLPSLIVTVYKQIISFFLLPGGSNSFTTLFMVLLNLAVIGLGLLCLVVILMPQKNQLWRVLGALAMGAVLPLAMGFSQIISPFADATPLMKYAYVSAYLLVLMLADLALPALQEKGFGRYCGPAIAACLVALCLYNLNINNLLYTASAQAHRSAESYATRLLSRIEGCPGYTGNEDVVIIGGFPTDRFYSDVESYALVDHYSVPVHTLIPLNKHIYYYFNDWLNVPISEPDESVMIAAADSVEFHDMPLYPADGSVRLINGDIVVKVQEHYTPKSDYEIAYENRR